MNPQIRKVTEEVRPSRTDLRAHQHHHQQQHHNGFKANPLNGGREGAASEGTGMDVVLHHLMIMQVANIKSIT